MGRRPSEERRRYWREVLARQRRSELPVAAFCRQHEVSPAAFYRWKRRLAGETSGKSTEVSFVPLPLGQIAPSRAAEFALHLPNGVQVTVPCNFDDAALGRRRAGPPLIHKSRPSAPRPSAAWAILPRRTPRDASFVPLTYVEQWERLFGFGDEIRAFMQQHNHELKRKER